MDHETADDLKRHFGVLAEDLRSDIRAVAEGQQSLANKMDVGFREVREELRNELQETRAMIHLSYIEVDRRLRDLESGR